MNVRIKMAVCLLIFGTLAGGVGLQPVLAVPDMPAPREGLAPAQAAPDKVTLGSKFTALRATSGSSFEFEIELLYEGSAIRNFDLVAKGPQKWVLSVRPGFEQKEIATIRLDPTRGLAETVKLVATPVPGYLPDPGDYTFTLQAAAGDIKGSIDVKGIVTARYQLTAATTEGRLNIEATAGEGKPVSIKVANTGSSTIDKVTFSSDKPSEWSITYNPTEVTGLAAGATRDVEATVKPPAKAIAGDYVVTLRFDTDNNLASSKIDLRVTVLTPTVWGWVGIGIVLLVVVGLAAIFWRFGRR